MRIRKFLSGAIAATTLVGFAGSTSVAQASPWSWAKSAGHGIVDRVEHAAVGVASIAFGGGALALSPVMAINGAMATIFTDTGFVALGLVAPIALAVIGAGALAFGGYELYKSHQGLHLVRDGVNLVKSGYNGARNAITNGKVVDIPMGGPIFIPGSTGSSANAGMHH